MTESRGEIGADRNPESTVTARRRSTSKSPNHFSVLLLDGDNNLALHVVRCLAQIRGIRIAVACCQRRMPVRFSRHCRVIRYPEDCAQSLQLEHLKHAIELAKPDVVMAVDEPAIRLLATHKSEIESMAAIVPVPDVSTYDIMTDKWLFSQYLNEKKLSIPATSNDLVHATQLGSGKQLSFPVLLKPRCRRNGDGIIRFDDPVKLRDYVTDVKTESSGDFLVQEFIEGDDIDCSVLCRRGRILAFTIQMGIIPRAGTFMAPAGIRFVENDEVIRMVRELVSCTKFSGIAHIDLRRCAADGSIKFIEANLRYWGSIIGSLNAGVNFPYLSCLAALGRTVLNCEFKKGIFVDSSAAVKDWLRRIRGKGQHQFGYMETGIPLAVRDPVAEFAKLIHRWRE